MLVSSWFNFGDLAESRNSSIFFHGFQLNGVQGLKVFPYNTVDLMSVVMFFPFASESVNLAALSSLFSSG